VASVPEGAAGPPRFMTSRTIVWSW